MATDTAPKAFNEDLSHQEIFMPISSRTLVLPAFIGLATLLTACGTPMRGSQEAGMPPAGYSSGAPSYPYAPATYQGQPAAYAEYGRVASVDLVRAGNTASNGTGGAIIGGVAGGVLGSTVGGGSGRSAATILGVIGGALLGSQIERNRNSPNSDSVHRITVQTDGGAWQTYDVGPTELRTGDRVRIENGQLYRV
jgi:outer membrane lipoprotein SlyB